MAFVFKTKRPMNTNFAESSAVAIWCLIQNFYIIFKVSRMKNEKPVISEAHSSCNEFLIECSADERNERWCSLNVHTLKIQQVIWCAIIQV